MLPETGDFLNFGLRGLVVHLDDGFFLGAAVGADEAAGVLEADGAHFLRDGLIELRNHVFVFHEDFF